MHLFTALFGYSAGRLFGKIGCLKIILLLVLVQGGAIAIALVLSLNGEEVKGWFKAEPISQEQAEYDKCSDEDN